MNNKEICIIRAKLKKDYVYDAISHYGYYIQTPYTGNSLFFRIFREIWFRCNLPFKKIWYRKLYKDNSIKWIILFDPLITPEYIEWLHSKRSDCKFLLLYENRADKTIRPDSVPKYVEKWSYDDDDCKQYSMNKFKQYFFLEYKRTPKHKPKYDVLYLGRDKGRAEYILNFEKQLNEMGLRTYFHICADRQFLRFKKRYYKKLLTYDEYLDLLIDSKAILNIVPEGQTSVTQREMEAAFDGIKCITNNKGIKTFPLYDESIFFLLGEDDINTIPEFLSTDVKIYDYEILTNYDFYKGLEQLVGIR
ncbi:hypothetical protein SAMN04487775_11313 [Treponema bryantii]|uniref:Glycosyltransferase family 52 n=1 Tax=Treponema bryantii TaxID=163 RepID=A0A1I3NA85_9SPIR|nr:hypothetical protein [Treponema bryantii]SFJ05736.1 hypothetical protein SAMN04487775_11313 [Treponema bryantii]